MCPYIIFINSILSTSSVHTTPSPRTDSTYIVNYIVDMSKRLQVMIGDEEFNMIRALAEQQRISIAEWVRRALQKAGQSQPRMDSKRKHGAVRSAIGYDFPTADINQMLGEIESGYGVE